MNSDSFTVYRACFWFAGQGQRNEVVSDATIATLHLRGLLTVQGLTPRGHALAEEYSSRSYWAVESLTGERGTRRRR